MGLKTRKFFATMVDIFRFTIASFQVLVRFHRRQGLSSASRVVLAQVYFTGLEVLPFLSLIALIVGFTVIVQSLPHLLGVGAHRLIGVILVISIIRELGPLLTAVIVASRSGAAIVTELATDKVLGEIEQLEAMGIDILHFIVVPRILGCIVATSCLIIYFDVVALIGGFLVAGFRTTMSFGIYMGYIFDALTLNDVYISFSKSMVFGLIIALLCCYHGLSAGRAATEIPRVARSGVIESVFFVFVLSAVVSALFYLT